jgi:hypothetical protein
MYQSAMMRCRAWVHSDFGREQSSNARMKDSISGSVTLASWTGRVRGPRASVTHQIIDVRTPVGVVGFVIQTLVDSRDADLTGISILGTRLAVVLVCGNNRT